jgi:hypothetical protein
VREAAGLGHMPAREADGPGGRAGEAASGTGPGRRSTGEAAVPGGIGQGGGNGGS